LALMQPSSLMFPCVPAAPLLLLLLQPSKVCETLYIWNEAQSLRRWHRYEVLERQALTVFKGIWVLVLKGSSSLLASRSLQAGVQCSRHFSFAERQVALQHILFKLRATHCCNWGFLRFIKASLYCGFPIRTTSETSLAEHQTPGSKRLPTTKHHSGHLAVCQCRSSRSA